MEKALDHQFLAACAPALESQTPVSVELPITNVDRTVGTLLGSAISKRYGGAGLPEDTISLTFTGSAGQSFGAFVPRGVTMRLWGDANDYFGKGLCGGRLVVRPQTGSPFVAEDQIIAGNVILYGATAGEVFIRGQVGERFCVRNSGATAVVEGVGDHGCEYMTGGLVVVLGPTGRNFAAGMSGGVAYLYDPDRTFGLRVNDADVDVEPLDVEDSEQVRLLVQRHADRDRVAGGRPPAGLVEHRGARVREGHAPGLPAHPRGDEAGRGPGALGGPGRDGGRAWVSRPGSSSSGARCPGAVRCRFGCGTGARSTSPSTRRRPSNRARAAWTAASPSATTAAHSGT